MGRTPAFLARVRIDSLTRRGREYVSVRRAARHLGVHVTRVYYLIREGTFTPLFHLGRRYVSVAELDRYRADRSEVWYGKRGWTRPSRRTETA